MFDQAKALAESVPGDVTFGVGFKETGGELSNTVALLVFVPEKKPESDLSAEETIPREFGGYPVDVVEWKPVLIEDSKAYKDLHGGIEIAPDPVPLDPSGIIQGQTSGTLGAIARRRSDRVMVLLTASHVIRDANGALVGDIHQPAGGEVVANTGKGTVERHDKGLDCAVVEPNGKRKLRATMEEVGPVRGVRVLSQSLTDAERQVAKRGRTTQLTTGRVTAFHAPDPKAPTLELIIAPSQAGTQFAWKGDSGSVVLSTDDEAVGLLYAALPTAGPREDPTETYGIATMINFVQDALEVHVVGLRPTLKKGAKGGDVRTLQEALVKAGFLTGPIDGKFGNGTLAAVKKFQAKHIPPADGIVAGYTWDKLVELGHAPPP
ncbi:MAG TPA: peptidoglycan-binding protein [Thermoleophilaceae bacterium]